MRLQQYLDEGSEEFYDILASNHKKFHEHMTSMDEMFDKDVKLDKPIWDGKYFTVKFTVENTIYTFKAMENDENEYSILFYSFGKDSFDIKGDKRYVGDVFSGVVKSLQALIKTRNVEMFWFNTNESKLIKLYDKVLKKLERKFKGYEFNKSLMVNGYKFWRFERRK